VEQNQNKNKQQNKDSWACPCNGCKKAKHQAFKEILAVLDSGGDAYSRISNIKKLIEDAIIVKKG
jgi:hypothetical protein